MFNKRTLYRYNIVFVLLSLGSISQCKKFENESVNENLDFINTPERNLFNATILQDDPKRFSRQIVFSDSNYGYSNSYGGKGSYIAPSSGGWNGGWNPVKDAPYGNKGVTKYDYHPPIVHKGHRRPPPVQVPAIHTSPPVPAVPVTPEINQGAITIVTCDIGHKCHNFVHCASYPDHYFRAKDRCCLLNQFSKGMCCSATYPESSERPLGSHFNPYPTDTVKVPEFSDESIQTAAEHGYNYLPKYKNIEVKLIELGLVVEKGTADYGHLQFFQTTQEAINLARDNVLVMKTCGYLQDTYYLTNDETGIGLQGYDFGGTVFQKMCPPTPKCEISAKYRTYDGSCNNPGVPKLGQSMTPLLRLLAPDYADGIWAPRVRKDDTPLPSARLITRSLVPDANLPDPRYSHLLAQFGQFIDHDFSHVPIFRFGDMSGIQCCGGNSAPSHPACFPIEIPPGDTLLQDKRCMNFARSMIAPRIECTFGHADQLNQLTHWLDGSQIYGSNLDQAESLREFSGGQLRITRDGLGRHLLPFDLDNSNGDGCSNPNNGNSQQCFVAGDKRVNEQIGLTTVHTIWLREHNRVASALGQLNPEWNDEILYQESRRIVVAEYQHIVYNEWLPIVIGREYMLTFGILPSYDGYYKGYDANVDPTVSNAFTTAAFRMGHTLIQGVYNVHSVGGGQSGRLVLHDFFNNPHLLKESGFIDSLNKGFLTQPIQRFDNFVTTELRDNLFKMGSMAGMDLIALNIQRGRDHGLRSYNDYRDLCRLGKARDFSDLSPIIHPRKIANLEKIYGNVNDIDLFIGGIHETPLQGALVGPTFVCIIGDQFARAKKGDRYFYDVGNEPGSFTSNQLHEIRRASMARILCDNSDEIRSIQPLVFYLPNGGFNPMLPCGSPSIPHVNLKAWQR